MMPSELDADAGYRLALRWLEQRNLTRVELERRLERRGCAESRVVVDRLRERGWQSDDRVLQEELSAAERQGLGAHRVAARLAQRGIDRAAAVEAIARLDPERERAAAAKEARSLAARGWDGQRIARRLARRGFSTDVIWAIVRTLGDESPDTGPPN